MKYVITPARNGWKGNYIFGNVQNTTAISKAALLDKNQRVSSDFWLTMSCGFWLILFLCLDHVL